MERSVVIKGNGAEARPAPSGSGLAATTARRARAHPDRFRSRAPQHHGRRQVRARAGPRRMPPVRLACRARRTRSRGLRRTASRSSSSPRIGRCSSPTSSTCPDQGERQGRRADRRASRRSRTTPDRRAELTIPKADPPTETKFAVLKQGDGEPCGPATRRVQYKGVSWRNGQMFDSSWSNQRTRADHRRRQGLPEGARRPEGRLAGDRDRSAGRWLRRAGFRSGSRRPTQWCSWSTS